MDRRVVTNTAIKAAVILRDRMYILPLIVLPFQ